MSISFYISCLLLFFLPMKMSGADKTLSSPQPDGPQISIRIDSGELDLATGIDTVDLIMESDSSLGGFDLKLMIENRQVEIVEILPGRLIDSCRWEFFNAHELTVVLDNSDLELPAWQITALPELIPDTIKPVCYGGSGPISLCRIVVSKISLGHGSADQGHVPLESRILFVWEDCSDNTISSFSGKNLWLSWHAAQSDSTSKEVSFPNRSGTAPSCFTVRNTGRVTRLVSFEPGTISILENEVEKASVDSSDS